jgi:hypothetical protein
MKYAVFKFGFLVFILTTNIGSILCLTTLAVIAELLALLCKFIFLWMGRTKIRPYFVVINWVELVFGTPVE